MATLSRVILAGLFCLALHAQPPSQRRQLLQRMAQHPGDPWPPMRGHVVLAEPGSRPEHKGYHEPGAWFSPAPGSFGMAPLPQSSDLSQTLNGFAIRTVTPAWAAEWQAAGNCEYRLSFIPKQPGTKIRLQSAGPAGAPLRIIERQEDALLISGGWSVSPARGAVIGGEGDWMWAEIPVEASTTFVVRALAPCVAPAWKPAPAPQVNLPDVRFAASLQAQINHLLMGVAGAETRPGETVNYPLPWLRDGAYALAALARAGQLDAARALARKFSEEDFFGGFGPEADAPGLALWALEEAAARLRDPLFDQRIWPHVFRKAEYIRRMRRTQTPIREVVQGPIVPRYWKDPELDLVCDAARDGLIIGRMDHHRPLLYVNAVSYAGLQAAAELATRLRKASEAARWREDASELRKAWWRAFDTKERQNERTSIVGLWPSWIAANDAPAYRQALPAVEFAKRPLWTYFDLARAHNFLLAGNQDAAWTALEYFWNNQPSPGLYTLWEGDGEENSFGLWERLRGWARPPHVTPHYWAASEMLHLQLDMLAYVDQRGQLVLGAGIPAGWLDRPMSVRGIHTRLGVVNWAWSNGKMTATLDGKPAPFRLGPAFPPLKK